MAKRKTRMSGVGMNETTAFAVWTDDGWTMDLSAVQARIEEYLGTASEEGKFSIAGLCIALGVARETLLMWRRGYASASDEGDGDVAPNERLAQLADTGLLHIQKHWEEDGSSGVQSKYVKMLESSGALGDASQPQAIAPFDMGSLKKFCK